VALARPAGQAAAVAVARVDGLGVRKLIMGVVLMLTLYRRLVRPIVLALLASVLAACGGAAQSDRSNTSALTLAPCQLAAPELAAHLPAKCATLTVFENRAVASGRTIDLHVAVVPARGRNPAPDPLFLLTGGPGQAATETYPLLAPAFEQINLTRDIVLLDQRGTGQSHPLRCPEFEQQLEPPSESRLAAWLVDCLEQLDADPRLYTTPIAMEDLDQLRAALGYERINLYGLSYGTRAALTYMRQHPDRVRAAILDGVLPQEAPLGLAVARDAQRSIDMIFDRCAADAACARAFPDPRAEFTALLEQLGRQPARLSLAHPISGAPTELVLDRDTLATSVRLLSYAPETAALLPLLIHTASASGDARLLAAQALLMADQLGSISNGMNLAVLCSEDAPFFTEAQAEASNASTYLGDGETNRIQVLCASWPRGELSADFKQPVVSDVPTLLLSGEADPVTPPANADQAAKTLPNSLHVVAPGQGHNVIGRGCLSRLAAEFMDGGSVAGLQTDCAKEIRPMPFFTSFAGTEL
jgi:pimeloyl-ACP methyl ester carboxylesterase